MKKLLFILFLMITVNGVIIETSVRLHPSSGSSYYTINTSINLTNLKVNSTNAIFTGLLVDSFVYDTISETFLASDCSTCTIGSTDTEKNIVVGYYINKSIVEEKQVGRAYEGIPIKFTMRSNWNNSHSSVGFKHVVHCVNLTTTASVQNATVNGSCDDVNYSVSGQTICVEWNKSLDSGEIVNSTINYTEPAITLLEGDPIQDPDNEYSTPYDGIFDSGVPWEKSIIVRNTANSTIHNLTVNATIPCGTEENSTKLYDPGDNLYDHYENITNQIVEWNISSISANSTQSWRLYYKTRINVSRINWSESNGREYWKKQINLTTYSGTLEIKNIKVVSHLPNQTKIARTILYKDDEDITTDPDYVVDFSDIDGDGNNDYIEWKIPSLSSKQVYKIVNDMGYTIDITTVRVILNKPVQEAKDIDWRLGLKFDNLNEYGIDYTYKVDMPLEAYNIYQKENGIKILKEMSFSETEGNYVTISIYLPPESNTTTFLYYTSPSIETYLKTYLPDVYWADQDTVIIKNVTIKSALPDSVTNISKTVDINYGEDFSISCRGELLDEQDIVRDHYEINLDNLSAYESVICELRYEIPVAEVELLRDTTNAMGNNVRLYHIKSTSLKALDPVKFEIDDVDCKEIVEVRIFKPLNKTIDDFECGSTLDEELGTTVISMGKLAVNEEIQVIVEYREADIEVKPDPHKIVDEIIGVIAIGAIIMLLLSAGYWGYSHLKEKEGGFNLKFSFLDMFKKK